MTAPEVNAVKELTKAVKELTRVLRPKEYVTTIFADNGEYLRFGPEDIIDQELVKTVKNVLLDYDDKISQWDAQEIVRLLTDAGVAFTRITP